MTLLFEIPINKHSVTRDKVIVTFSDIYKNFVLRCLFCSMLITQALTAECCVDLRN